MQVAGAYSPLVTATRRVARATGRVERRSERRMRVSGRRLWRIAVVVVVVVAALPTTSRVHVQGVPRLRHERRRYSALQPAMNSRAYVA
jgi:hypothetical protein